MNGDYKICIYAIVKNERQLFEKWAKIQIGVLQCY